jgi:hypothetical protein
MAVIVAGPMQPQKPKILEDHLGISLVEKTFLQTTCHKQTIFLSFI